MRVIGVTKAVSSATAKNFLGKITKKDYLTYKTKPWHNPISRERFGVEEVRVVRRRKLQKNEAEQFEY